MKKEEIKKEPQAIKTPNEKVVEMATCKDCGEIEEFEPDEFGINYFQAIGECPICKKPTYYKNGEPTKIEIIFAV